MKLKVWKDVPRWIREFAPSQNTTTYPWGLSVHVWEALAPLYPNPLVGSWRLPVCPQPNVFSQSLCGRAPRLWRQCREAGLRPGGHSTRSTVSPAVPGKSLDFIEPWSCAFAVNPLFPDNSDQLFVPWLIKSFQGRLVNATMRRSDSERGRTTPVWFPTRLQAVCHAGHTLCHI